MLELLTKEVKTYEQITMCFPDCDPVFVGCSPVEQMQECDPTPCGPDYGSDCMPDCDPSDDY
ncbi:hypothetical protein [Lutispora thermophila]|uniref:Uncharacterized protein n=1 Tax=Lutispora thermophila DSM 19022 TaxID=1122184 RepID=A0A1M6ETM7_9FIRM|nr:hypothetical protein [Lutispora thermophila]SHI88773.1 hypothetical protein SAMN02745176_01690 [Lutispora thermophila DSM 19022]